MLKKLLQKHLLGRVRFQPTFERLNKLSLAGMNYGNGYDINFSGESDVIKRLSSFIEKGEIPVVFDVGANVGDYAKSVLSYLRTNVRLYCFEPSKAAYASLSQNLSNYENVNAYNFGLGDEAKIAILYADAEGSGLGSVFARRLDHLGIGMRHTEEISLRRMDDFCKQNGIQHIHLLKLDVEGYELNVLRGAAKLIDSGVIDLIQFEFGGCNIDSRTYFQDFFYLLNPRYRIHRIVKQGLVPIDKYEETHEIFITTNYLAISRST